MKYALCIIFVVFALRIFSVRADVSAEYLGCYKDLFNDNDNAYSFKDPSLTTRKCFTVCREHAFIYAALNATDCFCARNPIVLYHKSNENECDTACSGGNETCGGTLKLSVYYLTQKCTAVKSLNRKDVYLGCYQDSDDRKLNGYLYEDKAMTVDKCKKECQAHGFLFAGLQQGIYCYCGNEQPLPADKIEESLCNYYCQGHDKCGGDMKNTIFAVGECTRTDASYTKKELYVGCFKDAEGRQLYEYQFNSNKLSLDYCFAQCKRRGFVYAALRAGKECFCGNRHAAFNEKVDSKECVSSCPGDNWECGGHNKSSVYYMNQTCLNVSSEDISEKIYLGCYLDDWVRKLNGYYYAGLNSPEICIQKCKEQGFTYAGVQNADQCFCGNEEQLLENRMPESDCNKECTNDKSQMCGGWFRNGLYEAGKCVRVKDAYDRDELFLGCFSNPELGLNGYSFSDLDMTLDYCFENCKKRGFTYAAIQAAKTCYCGNNHIAFEHKTGDKNCYMFCSDEYYKCGGKNTFNLYGLNINCTLVSSADVTEKTYLGCYLDTYPRKLNGYYFAGLNSPEICIQKCKEQGFIYAGVQNADQCFCGNEEQLLENRMPESDCNKQCTGDKNQTCGGWWRNGLYEAGNCVVQVGLAD